MVLVHVSELHETSLAGAASAMLCCSAHKIAHSADGARSTSSPVSKQLPHGTDTEVVDGRKVLVALPPQYEEKAARGEMYNVLYVLDQGHTLFSHLANQQLASSMQRPGQRKDGIGIRK